MDVCILLSSYDKYAKLAELTVELIHERWKDHPQIFVCGISTHLNGNVVTLPLDRDERDWIGITRVAAGSLLEKGYKKFYLILEDHPPLGACNDIHLNKTLPSLMNKLSAVYIGLHGWGQNTSSEGEMLGMKYNCVQRQSDTFLWRYALHPALWDIRFFYDLTNVLMETGQDVSMRSAWAFERRSGALTASHIKAGRSYRVFGLGMLGGNLRLIRGLARRFFYFLLNLLFLVIKKLGLNSQEGLADYFMHELLFYDGPYPLYWSGVMQKGNFHKNFERYLLAHWRSNELTRFQRAFISK